MKREILFTGISVKSDEWVAGDLVHNYIHHKTGMSIVEAGGCVWHEVYPETVSQYTGMKDKKGEKIFEDDIVAYNDESGKMQMGVVKFSLPKLYVEAIGGDDEGNQDLELHPDHEFEVIGDIHSDPELLEVNK